MIRYAIALAMAAALAVSAAAEAQVYKCKDASGASVYSQQPCGTDAREVKTRKAPAVDVAAISQQQSNAGKVLDAGYRYSECMNAVDAQVVAPSRQRIAGYREQIAGLNRSIRRANNNVAGASWEAGLRGQIAGLEQAIATERTALDARAGADRQRCADVRTQASAAPKASPEA